MQITSPDFTHNAPIPAVYTCQGKDINPTLVIEGIPNGTKTLVLILDDPDAPVGTFVHWVVFNIPPTNEITKDSIPGTQGMNDFKRENYGGPCPPSGTHRYFFKVYALDKELDLQGGATKQEVEAAMKGHILDHAEMIGLYKKT